MAAAAQGSGTEVDAEQNYFDCGIMEGEGDDQGSGWLEVKKKHRSNSKLSMQKASGGSFKNRQTFSSLSQTSKNNEVRNMHHRCQVKPTKEGLGFDVHSNASSDSHGSSAVLPDHGIECLDKVVINNGGGPIEVVTCTSTKVAASDRKPKVIQGVLVKENVDIIPKIKWGDLEEVGLLLSKGCENSSKIGNSESLDGSDGTMQEHADVADSGEPTLNASLFTPPQVGEVTSEDAELFPIPLSLGVHDERSDETWKEVSEICIKDLGSVSVNPKDVVETSKAAELELDGDLDPEDTVNETCSSSPLGSVDNVIPQEPCDESENVALNVSEISITNENAGIVDYPPDTNLLSHLNNSVEFSVDSSVTEASEDPNGQKYDPTEAVDFEEGEQGESKERFRERLWCFLFENLNRAVDELYLLCELECDVQQMKEAILVLEEAASDFKELKCRVEHFENMKRTISQSSKDGMPVNVKTDHRRPHALSWEVRRMTTSPHRAEILSSSLEAFKKIQSQRAGKPATQDAKYLSNSLSTIRCDPRSSLRMPSESRTQSTTSEKQGGTSVLGNTKVEKLNMDASRQSRVGLVRNGRLPLQSQSATGTGKPRREPLGPVSETEKQLLRKDKTSAESKADKQSKITDTVKKSTSLAEKEKEKDKEKHSGAPWKPMDAWREKRNWEDILKSPMRSSTRVSQSPGLARKGMERARVLHDKLMSPEKKKKTALDLKREAEEKHARAMRIRSQLENERVQRLQRTSEKLNRVNEWQAVRSLKLREGMYARHQRSETRHEAYLAQVAKRAGDESSKVNEVRFITSLNEENKKLILRQKLQDSEMRRAEKLQVIRIKQKEDTAREEAVLERRKLLEAEKLQRLAEMQRRKEEAQVRREEERKASSAAREAKTLEQHRKKEVRARAQLEEAELLAQKLAERLSESEQRRKSYLEQIREKASMDFRDQSSPLLRRSVIKEGQNRSISANSVEEYQTSCISGTGDSSRGLVNVTQQQSLKRRIKKIRQKLMSLKYEFIEPPIGSESLGIGHRASVGTARAKIGRWLQELQRLRQARKEGAASIGLIVGEMVKFLEGKDAELHASRQAGLLDFVSSALPASHTSKPEACQVTGYLLRLLRVAMSMPANRSYFLAQNLLPPIIPMLSASLENYIKIAASTSGGCSNLLTSKASTENLETITETLDGFLWTVTTIVGHARTDERQLQMQDGLLELIVAYQIIHRLRDLFALYDRPQVEGSPFPSSIILSLNLLAVLTSRPRTISSIDWESCIPKDEADNKFQQPESLASQGMGEISMISRPAAMEIAYLQVNESDKGARELQSGILSMPEIPNQRPLDGESMKDSSVTLDCQGNVGDITCEESATCEVQNLVAEEHAKSVPAQKIEKNSIDGCVERKRMNEQNLHENKESKKICRLKQPMAFLLSVITETGLVGLPSLLTAVLLQANNRLSSEQIGYFLCWVSSPED
ncbi:uncharacterized protein LOC109845333 [Asparagus officinalis]|uniref:uncharacterized protein LOC109845333 n=1 Tax=Asparagus officinalis TaxID=4686 RepID=UPI00098E2BCA|nr:uncharacterized protein LOC109845333 [Asparagus officinalis]